MARGTNPGDDSQPGSDEFTALEMLQFRVETLEGEVRKLKEALHGAGASGGSGPPTGSREGSCTGNCQGGGAESCTRTNPPPGGANPPAAKDSFTDLDQ